MKLQQEALQTIAATRKFFARTTACLAEGDSTFRATPETMTVAQQVAHAAQVIDWFREGGFENRWDLDFEKSYKETNAITSLTTSRRWLEDAWQRLEERVRRSSEAELAADLPDNPILTGRVRSHTIDAIVDHCGHHRGALAVYARLLGKTPAMPYGDD